MNHIISYTFGEAEQKTNTKPMVTWRFSMALTSDRVDVPLAFCVVFQTFDDVQEISKSEVEEAINDAFRVNGDRAAMLRNLRSCSKHRSDIELFLVRHRLLEHAGRINQALMQALLDKSTEVLSWSVRKADAGVEQVPTKFLFVDVKVNEDALVRAFDIVIEHEPIVKKVEDEIRGWTLAAVVVDDFQRG